MNMAHREGDLSEAALTELYNECDKQFELLHKLQDDIILSEQDQCENRHDQTMNKAMVTTAMEAELNLLQSIEPELLSTNPEVLLQAGAEEMQQLCSQLEMVLSCCQAKKDKLTQSLEREEKWLKEKQEVLAAATEHEQRLKAEKEKFSDCSLLQDTKEALQTLKEYQGRLISTMGDLVQEHFPLPQDTGARKGRSKNLPEDVLENLLPLTDIIEKLMNKALETPHDAYVTLDEHFWPPYVEMLLRYDIATRHPENNFKIRLENIQ